jgi:hypothetical protein
MIKGIGVVALTLGIVFSGFAQTKDLKGPKYKNAKPSVKYDGSTSILIREDPYQIQGPKYKNFNPRNYKKVIIRPDELEMPNVDLVVSTEDKIYRTGDEKEKIIYRRVQTKDMKGKNTKGLKGPAYKNYKP